MVDAATTTLSSIKRRRGQKTITPSITEVARKLLFGRHEDDTQRDFRSTPIRILTTSYRVSKQKAESQRTSSREGENRIVQKRSDRFSFLSGLDSEELRGPTTTTGHADRTLCVTNEPSAIYSTSPNRLRAEVNEYTNRVNPKKRLSRRSKRRCVKVSALSAARMSDRKIFGVKIRNKNIYGLYR